MRKIKKLMSAAVSLMMVCTSMGGFTLWSSADDEDVRLDLNSVKSLSLSTNNNGETTYTLNGVTKVYTGKIVLEGTSENGFTVESGTHDIVFNGVTINDSIAINPSATANIAIEGEENKVTAKSKLIKNSFLWIDDTVGQAGINVPEGATLNLSGNGKLTVKGSDDGAVTPGDGGAGIGGNYKESAGTINIKDGTVTATGGDYAAGIGGGYNSNGGNINISGGTVNATGGFRGAGIGGGDDGNGGSINISGGTVNVQGGNWAAGIGGGYDGDSGNITIKNAIITATGGYRGSGIGGGNGYKRKHGITFNVDGECENITIDNSEVTATAGKEAEPIGGGADELYTGKVTINGKELSKETRKDYYKFTAIKVDSKGNVEK